LANVRFGADSGLKSDIASCPKSAMSGREQLQQILAPEAAVHSLCVM
jgi:hypothetical protein